MGEGRKTLCQCLVICAESILFLYGIALMVAAYWLSTLTITALVGESLAQVTFGFGVLTVVTACFSRVADIRRWSAGFYIEVFNLLVLFFLESSVILYCFFQWSEREDTSIQFWERLDDYGKMVVMSNYDCCGWDGTCNTNTAIYHEYRAYKDTLCYNSTAGDYRSWVEIVAFVLGVTAGFHLLYVIYPCICQGRRLRRKMKEKIRLGAWKMRLMSKRVEHESTDSETTTSYEENTIRGDAGQRRTSGHSSSKRSAHTRGASFNQGRRSRSGASFNQGRRSRSERRDSKSNRRRDSRRAPIRQKSAPPGKRVIAKPNEIPYSQYPRNAFVNDSKVQQQATHKSMNAGYNSASFTVSPGGTTSRRTNSGGTVMDFTNPSSGNRPELFSLRKNPGMGSKGQFNNFSMKNRPRRAQSVGTAFDQGNQGDPIAPRITNHHVANSQMGGSTVRSSIPYYAERQQPIVPKIARGLSFPYTNMARYPSSIVTEPIHGSFYGERLNDTSISEVEVLQPVSHFSLQSNYGGTSTGQFYSMQDLNPV